MWFLDAPMFSHPIHLSLLLGGVEVIFSTKSGAGLSFFYFTP